MFFRTDLALEQTENLEQLPDGVQAEQFQKGNIIIHRVNIVTDAAAKKLQKQKGRYITIDVSPFYAAADYSQEEIQAVAQEIELLIDNQSTVLVVGLGNRFITPDAIGPQTADKILATRHLGEAIKEQSGLEKIRPVAVVAPGVAGQTGMETSEMIKSLVKIIHPSCVVVVDALAARSLSRLGRTIQIADSGISPGAGVFNNRNELSYDSLGVPVVSVGIPTVVDCRTLISDIGQEIDEETEEKIKVHGNPMIVTPKEIDLLVQKAAGILSMAINKALQPDFSIEDITYLTN